MKYAKIVLKSGKDQSLRRYHPWVFSGAIKKIYGEVQEGDYVEVYNNKDEFLGLGHYQPASIAVRIISFQPIQPDENFWRNKIQKAIDFRKNYKFLNDDSTNVFRLIHAEGDQMPGLIADYYHGTLILQMHSIGMYKETDTFIKIFRETLGDKVSCIFNKSSQTLPYMSGTKSEDLYLFGKPESNIVQEYGNKFIIDWEGGQKTGFFIDQRENRKLVEQYSENRDVLNMFGYTGGFSIYALRGSANFVHSVDSSQKAIDLTNENVKLNFGDEAKHEAFSTDAFKYLDNIDQKYDLIILDPPAFAKHHNVLNNALQGYKRLNMKAIEKIKPGGILFTFSCSQVVSKENFRKSVFTAAANTGRNVRILHQLSQPVDHPVNIYHPESEYLKGFVLYIE